MGWASRGRPKDEVWQLDGIADVRRRLRSEVASLSQNATDFLQHGETIGLARRRQSRWFVVAGSVIAAVVTIASLVTAAELSRREKTTKEQAALIALAAADTGLSQLELELVDWDAKTGQARPVDAAEFPNLQTAVYDVDPRDPHRPGAQRDSRFVQMGRKEVHRGRVAVSLETRSGAAFLKVAGRGRNGVDCPPSLLHLRSLPGYVERNHGPVVLRVTVPTCAASAEATVEIPSGPFIFGGEGVPPIQGRVGPVPERQVTLPRFAIDRTEVPNAWYGAYVKNELLTGEGMPDYPPDDVIRDAAKPEHPVTGLDAFAAEAFCAWQGKRLPSAEEWIKAARGGLTLDSAAKTVNPLPRRNLPWGEGDPAGRTNLRDSGDPWKHTSPVNAFPAGASPYGVLSLVDNVSEWTSTTPEGARAEALRIILGAAWDSEIADGLHSIAALNQRSPRFFMFTIGVRCASDRP